MRDFKAPSVPAPSLPKGKGEENETAEGEGGKMLKPQGRRIGGIQEESIEKGETILSGWETFTERENRIQKECGKSGETYRAEDDWSIAERQAEDIRRALGNAQMRKTQYPPTAVERSPMTYLANWTGGYACIWTKEPAE